MTRANQSHLSSRWAGALALPVIRDPHIYCVLSVNPDFASPKLL
jgi:hypothetical protein